MVESRGKMFSCPPVATTLLMQGAMHSGRDEMLVVGTEGSILSSKSNCRK
jgi:hypothetical protein